MNKDLSIYLISGASGASGRLLLETILAQFPNNMISLCIKRNIRSKHQLIEIIREVEEVHAIIVHTMVDPHMRQLIQTQASENQIECFDLMGPIFEHLSKQLKTSAQGKPGIYQDLHQDYFDRVAAIEFTVTHDDGRNPKGLSNADIILTGVSRSGKTPLSMYLAVLGYKVANIPFVSEELMPQQIYEADPMRIFGLTLNTERLITHRREREKYLGINQGSAYTNMLLVNQEIGTAERMCKKNRWKIINVSNKAIESTANEIIEIYSRRFIKNKQ